jgi:hypothetical protein
MDASVPEAASPMDAHADRPPFDASACDNATGPCVVVPGGWTLVAFAPTQAAACPAGFDAAPAVDVVEGPDASGGCSCATCSVTTPPSCASGEVMGFYDSKRTAGEGMCGMPDTMPILSNDPPGACLTDVYQGSYATFDVQYDAPAPTGGACRAPGVADSTAITYAARSRTCSANDAQATGCTGDVCHPTLPAGYAACIAAPGAQPCPQGPLGVQHVVGTSATFACGDCGCTTTATCAGTLTLFTDTKCKGGANPLAANTCTAIAATGATYEAYEYDGGAPTGVACQTGAAGAAQDVTLAGEQTLCCAQ